MAFTPEQSAILEKYNHKQANQISMIEQQLRAKQEKEASLSLQKKLKEEDVALEAYRSKLCELQVDEINKDMDDLIHFVKCFAKNELSNKQSFDYLITTLDDFKATMISEVNDTNKDAWRDPVSAVKKLNETVKVVFDPDTTVKEKSTSVTNFHNYTRNSKFSKDAKMLMATALSIAIILSLVTLTFLPPLGLGAFLGITLGIFALSNVPVIASFVSTFSQDDYRGRALAGSMIYAVNSREATYGAFFNKKPDLSNQTNNKSCPESFKYTTN